MKIMFTFYVTCSNLGSPVRSWKPNLKPKRWAALCVQPEPEDLARVQFIGDGCGKQIRANRIIIGAGR